MITPLDLFNINDPKPCWIRGSDIGEDERGKIWVKSEASLLKELPSEGYLKYAYLTPAKKIGLARGDGNEQVWDLVQKLEGRVSQMIWILVH